MKSKTTERKAAPRRRKSAAGKRKTAVHQTANPERKYELFGLLLVAVSLISLCGIGGFNRGCGHSFDYWADWLSIHCETSWPSVFTKVFWPGNAVFVLA